MEEAGPGRSPARLGPPTPLLDRRLMSHRIALAFAPSWGCFLTVSARARTPAAAGGSLSGVDGWCALFARSGRIEKASVALPGPVRRVLVTDLARQVEFDVRTGARSVAISPKGPQRSSDQGTIFVEAPDVVPRPYLPNTARPQWVRSPLLRSVPFHMSCLRRRRPSALSSTPRSKRTFMPSFGTKPSASNGIAAWSV